MKALTPHVVVIGAKKINAIAITKNNERPALRTMTTTEKE